MLVKDVMSRKVVTVDSRLTLSELAKLFEERAISGAPVLGPDGAVVGVVSQSDLVRARREAPAGVARWYTEVDGEMVAEGMQLEEIENARVEHIMTPGAISFEEDAPLEEAARAMLERHIHRVLVTRQGRLAGILTSMDMMRALIPDGKKPSVRKHAPKRRGK